ncbi:Dor1-like protein [Trichodelitschia bisporula]|uniref:Conserved oligomeric Golgi complex subunit 8 n=1 Tax=Trichodelitschia bisporula TaxID=703511 RepID=A0A6G1HUM6_9PEZI|nr:Dor1-like protein [Trichodelitschia bisporula]
MADPIFELLVPYFDGDESDRPLSDAATTQYINHLTTLSLTDLTITEPAALSHASHTLLRSLQGLSKRSHKHIIASAAHLSQLSPTLPELYKQSSSLVDSLPDLESSAVNFTGKYRRSADSENEVLARRKKALLLAQNSDRIASILELPTLLNTAISAASQGTSVNYTSALDLYAYIKRLAKLYANSPLIKSITEQAEHEMRLLTSNLIAGLQAQGIKLAGAMRMVGWLRRVAPELDQTAWEKGGTFGSSDGGLGALFLVCRLANLVSMLSALEPLRELADQETAQREAAVKRWTGGQQTERYLKRYVEIFREQSFAIVSMYRSVFPSALPTADARTADALLPLPSPLATFPAHLVDMLFDVLRTYLPNVWDRAGKDSLMTQVLYCAGSLGRLGGDFSMMLAFLEDEDGTEWIEVMKKHRVQASRLELLASGVGAKHVSPV